MHASFLSQLFKDQMVQSPFLIDRSSNGGFSSVMFQLNKDQYVDVHSKNGVIDVGEITHWTTWVQWIDSLKTSCLLRESGCMFGE